MDSDVARTPERVAIFDTSLRDGEQSPGCSMTAPQKLRFAHALAELGVDTIEAGFPASSDSDLQGCAAIAREVRGAAVATLARCHTGDIDACARALEHADRPRIHVFISTSPLHREHKLGLSREQVIERAIAGVALARRYVDDVEFSAEDALRTEPEFLAEICSAALAAGARTLNIPDTVGYTTPAEIRALFEYLRANVRDAERAVFSAHCHDDLGLAVANSLAAIEGGARQVECTINGIGERAGNCALEELVMALETRKAYFNATTAIDTRRLVPTSRLLTRITGMQVQRNKAIVGANAFAHESGIHQHGMLKHASTYEIMRPQDVGLARSSLVLGKHSGRHALRERIRELGFTLEDAEFTRVFEEFKALADKKKELFDGDIEALVLRAEGGDQGPWTLAGLRTASQGGGGEATVVLQHADGTRLERSARGDGPVDAAFKAVEDATGIRPKLQKFELRSLSEGEDAQGEAVVYVEFNQRSYRGASATTDIVESATRAFLEVINRIEQSQRAQAVA
jgi:2-isopropylmalate synthase